MSDVDWEWETNPRRRWPGLPDRPDCLNYQSEDHVVKWVACEECLKSWRYGCEECADLFAEYHRVEFMHTVIVTECDPRIRDVIDDVPSSVRRLIGRRRGRE